MSSWWYVLIIVIAAAAGMVYLRMRRDRDRDRARQAELGSDEVSSRDYPQEREANRSANLSADDRAWEAASLQRERDSQAKPTPPDGD